MGFLEIDTIFLFLMRNFSTNKPQRAKPKRYYRDDKVSNYVKHLPGSV